MSAAAKTTRGTGASKRGSHRLADVMVCPRKWYLRYVEGLIELKDKRWRQSGTLIHQVIAWHYAERMVEPPDWYKAAINNGVTLADLLDALGKGRPADIRNAMACLEAYRAAMARYPNGDPWRAKYVEHEFEARVGDLDKMGADEVLEVAWRDEAGKLRTESRRLNDEIVTCRVDMVVDVGNGNDYVVDHKSQRPGWSRKTLAVLREDGDFTIHWQGLFNLHIVRVTIPDVRGFIIQRINRDPPHDVDRHPLHIPVRAYEETPRVIRALVKRELELGTELAKGGRPMPHYWECQTRYGPCDFRDLCAADTQNDVNSLLKTNYTQLSAGEDDE